MKRISKLIAALLLPVCLVFTGCPDIFAAETEEAVFRISSVEDLVRLSEKCRVNSWSDGLTVELDADLDLTGAESVGSIACFNGTFHGNSHTIGNLAGQSALFQTIGKDAYVSDLTITGAITSTRDNTPARSTAVKFPAFFPGITQSAVSREKTKVSFPTASTGPTSTRMLTIPVWAWRM